MALTYCLKFLNWRLNQLKTLFCFSGDCQASPAALVNHTYYTAPGASARSVGAVGDCGTCATKAQAARVALWQPYCKGWKSCSTIFRKANCNQGHGCSCAKVGHAALPPRVGLAILVHRAATAAKAAHVETILRKLDILFNKCCSKAKLQPRPWLLVCTSLACWLRCQRESGTLCSRPKLQPRPRLLMRRSCCKCWTCCSIHVACC